MFDLTYVLKYLYPDGQFVIVGNPLSKEEFDKNVVWHGPDSKPSWEYVQSNINDAQKHYYFELVRIERNYLLTISDWTQVADAPVDKVMWAKYRQALRDLPKNIIDPENPKWPKPPEF